jgi:lysozyme
MSRLTASRAAFDLIASFEGFRTRAVLAPGGKWTLGFGHTATAREGLSVTRGEAEDLLRWDLLPIEDSLRQIALTPLTQNQFDALLSFAFNIGLENFKKSDVLKYLNQGQPIAAALSMHAWRRARVNGRVITIDALVRRRAAEAALFLEPVGARAAAPTSMIAPQVDEAATVSLASALTSPQTPATGKIEVTPEPKEAATEPEKAKPATVEKQPEPKPETPALAPAKPPSAAAAASQDVLRQTPPVPKMEPPTPRVAPPLDIPPKASSPPAPNAPQPKVGPIVPEGIAPFPGGPVFATNSPPANANGGTSLQSLPANDGYNTRLHATPEAIEAPSARAQAKVEALAKPAATPVDWQAVVPWITLTLGTALLAFGLFYCWKSGILSVAGERREPTSGELGALMAAASGFIMLVTGAIAAITGQNKDTEEVTD